jgi:hypothetical protein
MIPRPERVASDHSRHDPVLLAGLASGEALDAASRERAEAQLRCPACRALHADLVALTSSLRSDLPAPPRPRDFRLSPEHVAARPRRSWIPVWLSGGSLQPLGAAICSIGLLLLLAGVVLPTTSHPSVLQTVGDALSGAPSERAAGGGTAADQAAGNPLPSAAGSAGPSAAPAFSSDTPKAPQSSPRDGTSGASLPPGAEGVVGPTAQPNPAPAAGAATSAAIDPSLVLVVGGALLVVGGLGAFVVGQRRRASRPPA